MTAVRDEIMARLHRGNDPWADFKSDSPTKIQGWNSTHPFLAEAIAEVRPRIVVEIGVWKGASVVHMAGKMRDLGIDGAIIAVDTWLGSSEHWLSDEWSNDIPTLYHQFLDNIYTTGLTDYVVPLRLDSLNAARLLRLRRVSPAGLIHLDAGHDLHSVNTDLTVWWPLLAPNGVYLGDDYYLDGHFPEVKLATDAFFIVGLGVSIECAAGKCRVRKGIDETGPTGA